MKTVFSILILIVFLSGCQKEDIDTRDKYIGTWRGTQTIDIPSIPLKQEYTVVYVITKSDVYDNKILMNGGGDIIKAQVHGDSFVLEPWGYIDSSEGEEYTEEYGGSGSIRDIYISEEGNMAITYQGVRYPGTWSCELAKQ